MTRTLIKLCHWASTYYHHPVGEVFASAIPVLLRKGHAALEPIEQLQLTESGREFDPGKLARSPRQQSLLRFLMDGANPTHSELEMAGFKTPVIKALVEKKLVHWQQIALPSSPGAETLSSATILDYQDITPTREQVSAINASRATGTYLLFGITGSGKTEVYLRRIEETLKTGKQVLLLIPEIGLTPQTLNRFTERFVTRTTVIHSGLTDKQRLSAWREARSGAAKIIIGTRSAIFTPLANPGLIVVDEEHDGSYKQQEGFRYSARDIAVMRGHLEKIPVILGSATPSLESFHNCQSGKYKLLRLTERTGGANNETYQLINLRHEKPQDGFSSRLLDTIRYELDAGNQVLMFINRRGFAPVLYCQDCQWIAACHRCDARLTYHLADQKLICHHCGTISRLIKSCGSCSSTQVLPLGLGTQRLEETLQRLFPAFPVHRVDRDSTRQKGKLEGFLKELQTGKPMILVGTQMLAKGHHFPNLTLVAMVDIDAGFFSSDYRAMEKMSQLILQVGGRSGRESKKGKVIIQTQFADQPILKTLLDEGYDAFASLILTERKQNQLPPFNFHCLIRAESTRKQRAMNFLDDLARQPKPHRNVDLLGPVPANMEKRGGRYRAHLLVSSHSRSALHQVIAETIKCAQASQLAKQVRWSVDVDPSELF